MGSIAAGTRLGRFRVVAEVGRRGATVVYRARDEQLGRDVALKVLPADFASEPERRARFLREAREGAALSHPNIALVHEIGEAEGRLFVAMGLVPGEPLGGRLERGPVPVREALAIARGVALALARAHEKHLAHGALELDSVVVTAGGAPKVLDFGLAPESAGPEEDLRAFGRILGALLASLRSQGDDDLDGPAGVEPALAAIVARCSGSDPAARFASGADLVAALDHVGEPTRDPAREPRPSSAEALGGPAAPRAVPRSEATRARGARPRRSVAAVAVAALALVGAAGGVGALGGLSSRAKGGPAGSASGGAATTNAAGAATSVVDLPAPPGTRPEVAALWREALRAHREASLGSLRAANRRVLDADPTFAAARVHFAASALLDNDYDGAARDEARRARAEVASLSPRDRVLLGAVEAVLLESPADYAEALERLRPAAERFPGDAELWLYRGVVQALVGGPASALAPLGRAVALDPGYALARWFLAQSLDYAGRGREARAELAACLAAVPASRTCLGELAWLEQGEGRCDAMEAVARRLLLAAPGSVAGRLLLADALASRGQVPAAADALSAAHAGPGASRAAEALDLARLAALEGDFTAALGHARRAAALQAGEGRAVEHGKRARLEALALDESGDAAGAERVAADFLSRQAALEPNPRDDDVGVAAEPLPWLLPLAVRGGTLSSAKGDAQLAAWTAAWRARIIPGLGGFVWVSGAAAGALVLGTEASGRAAVGALDPAAPIPAYQPMALGEAAAGVALYLGGRVDDALPWLERAARKCSALSFPIEQTRAAYHLGRAREERADAAGACAAYRLVLDRWGRAKPRSVTGERAAARARALGCR
jgi:serine/threonine-protein kinase